MWYSRVDTNQPKGASSLMDSIPDDEGFLGNIRSCCDESSVVYEHSPDNVTIFHPQIAITSRSLSIALVGGNRHNEV